MEDVTGGWEVNGHTTWCTRPVCVMSQGSHRCHSACTVLKGHWRCLF